MKRLIFDLDGTLTVNEPDVPYGNKKPNLEVVAGLKKYRSEGFTIVIATARNMRTFEGSVGKINAFTLPQVVSWLDANEIPYDEIHVGKPWCGHEGFYVDDKAIRPSEFMRLNYSEIVALLAREAIKVKSGGAS